MTSPERGIGAVPLQTPGPPSGYGVYLPAVVRPEVPGEATATPAATPTATPPVNAAPLVPFDVDVQDLTGPSDWYGQYGKTPEIIVASNGAALDVLAQDYGAESAWKAVLLHISPTGSGYEVTQALSDLPMLDRVMGLAIDAAGNRYYATGVDERGVVNADYPPANTYRSDIVRVVKVDSAGRVQFNINLDPARHAFNSSAEMIINPMVFASARLAVGGDEIALVHGINTGPDANLGGARHQKALSTRLGAGDGRVLATSSVWVSHSFDQRLLYDGEGIIECHLGDAYPRNVVFGRKQSRVPLFYIKGELGANNTATSLGNIAIIENDPDYGYLALFATESTAVSGGSFINGPRNLAVVRVRRNDNSLDPNLPDSLTVMSVGVERTNRLRWLTGYTAASNLHATRPKLIGLGGDRYIVLWEQWVAGSTGDVFQGVYGMVIDGGGNTVRAATLITAQHHLPRGDDAFVLDGRAAWMTGSARRRELIIHVVDSALTYEEEVVTLP